MDDEELLKRRMQEQLMIQQQQKQMEEVLKVIRMQILDEKARERLSNLKVVKPDLAFQLEVYLAQLYQAGQIRGRITEEQLIIILKKMSEKRDFKIRRK